MNKVEKFITEVGQKNDYLLASMMQGRFDGEVLYDPETDTFATMVDGNVYGLNGRIRETSDFVGWDDYSAIEPIKCLRIKRDHTIMREVNE